MPATWQCRKYRNYDWALISSHAFAHHATFVGRPLGFRRMVYVHTPARYVWTPELDHRGNGVAARAVAAALRPLDKRRAAEGAELAANSEFIRRRIQRTWELDARVIHPPVEVERIRSVTDWRTRLTAEEAGILAHLPQGFILGASRFIPYKRLDLVIRTGEIIGRPVVLAGRGPLRAELERAAELASIPVHIIYAPSEALLYSLYQQADLYVFPAVEDFGIMPVEAMAAGTPVLAQSVGGTAESVVPGETGALVTFTDQDEIRHGVDLALASDPDCRLRRADAFSCEQFAATISAWVGAA
jgi:glycosyltransferase involved in cell wall biosynthesis